MKYFFKIITLLFIVSSLVGCRAGDVPLLKKDTQTIVKDEDIKYKIEKVILSKGFQSIEPNVEVVKKGNETHLIVSAGLLESSGISIDKIVNKNNIVNIHILNELDDEKDQLAVPQIIINIKNVKSLNLDELKFNIVNENYKPISIKLGLNDVITKVKSDFKVSTNSAPIINLSNINDKIIWKITYNSILDRDNPETPLVNLSVELDANSGEIIKSTKSFISSFIDEGKILDYVMDRYILYYKTDVENDNYTETVWYFDIKNNIKSIVYYSNVKITSAAFSPDYKNISVIETDGTKSDLFIVSRDEKKAYKVFLEEGVKPTLIKWKDKNNLIILDGDGKNTDVYNYNIKDDEIESICSLDKNIIALSIFKDYYLLTEDHGIKENKMVLLTSDWENFKFIDFGFFPRLISEDVVAYLKKNDKDDKNSLYLYDIKNNEEYDVIDLNISSISILPDDELFIVEKNKSNNDFTIYKYALKDKSLSLITNVNSEAVYYNPNRNLVYVDLVIPFESEKSEIIYSINLSKLK